MKRFFWMGGVILLAFAVTGFFAANQSILWAKDKDKDDKTKEETQAVAQVEPAEAGAPVGEAPAVPAEDPVLTNLGALNLQEVTVRVLGSEYQEELQQLQQMQAIFCDTYGLDVQKWRRGLYQYDVQNKKFIERAEEPAQAPAAVPAA